MRFDRRPSEARILEIVADGSPGGGTTHVLQVLRGLSDAFSFGLIAHRDSWVFEEAQGLGIPCFEADFFRSRLNPRVPLRLRDIVKRFEPQAVHAHGGRAAFFYASAAVRVPFVYTVHGYHFLHKAYGARQLALLAERLSSHRASHTIFVSHHDARVALAHRILPNSERSIVVHNGIRLADLPAPEPKLPKRIGFVGRLEYPKDPLLFLDVLDLLPGYTATIVGGGSLEHRMRTEIGRRGLSRARMVGTLAHSEALQALSSLSVLVMTSRWEGLPIVPLEAMWLGVPVVATNVGALDEVIEDGRSGLLVDGRSPTDLAQAVRRVTDDAALRERIVRNGRDRVRSIFSEERMLSEIQEVYRRVAKA